VSLLKEKGMGSTRLFVGGIIPNQDIETLRQMGVSEVFLPGASLKDIVERVERTVSAN
jgi:methylmalonyl-CoA mutase C-terminal domain/subunit